MAIKLRSLLFAPASRPELIEKFPRYRADACAIDLEDGTPEAEKAAARQALPGMVRSLRARGLSGQLLVRTNDARSPHVDLDLAAALQLPIDGLVMPKLSGLSDLTRFSNAIVRAEAETRRTFSLIGIIETAAGLLQVETLVTALGSRLTALAFGAEDFVTDICGRRTAEGLEVLYARSRVVAAARAAGLDALDQVCVDIRDDEAFRRDAELGRQLGYGGKMCVVPRQVEIANAVFSPSRDEIERSRRLIAAFERAQVNGVGAFDFEGGMVDEPMLRRARGILARAADAESA